MFKKFEVLLKVLVMIGFVAMIGWICLSGELSVDVAWLQRKPSVEEPFSNRPTETPTLYPSPSPTPTSTPTTFTGGEAREAPSGTPFPFLPAANAEGTPFGGGSGQIAFVSDRDGNPEIYSLDLMNGNITRLTFSDMADFHPRWSPDGRWITFTSYRDGGPDIHLMTATGALRQSLTSSDWFDEFPSWSPNGEWILFDANRPIEGSSQESSNGHGEEQFRLFIMSTDGGYMRQVLPDSSDGAVGTISPDGSLLAFQSRMGGGEYQIYTLDLTTGAVVRLTHTLARNFRATWSPDSRQLAFVSERDGSAEIYLMNDDGTNQRRVTQGQFDHVRGPSWSPDGEWILFNAEVEGNTDLFVIDIGGTTIYRLTQDPVDDYHPDWRP